jgi:hypothetical protein
MAEVRFIIEASQQEAIVLDPVKRVEESIARIPPCRGRVVHPQRNTCGTTDLGGQRRPSLVRQPPFAS